jgi:TRAP transporter 4TM/12TM fusion protein
MDQDEVFDVEEVSEPKTLSGIVVTVMAWSTILLTAAIYFAQFKIGIPGTEYVLHYPWDPPQNGYTIAHVSATGLVVSVWYLDKRFGLGGHVGIMRWVIGLSLFTLFVITGSYFFAVAEDLTRRSVYGTIPDLILGTMLFAMVLYLSWRYWGPIFPILALLFFTYIFMADLLPGALKGPSFDTHRIFTRLSTKLYGTIAGLGARFLWLLLIWGMMMSTAGAGVAILGLAKLLSKTGIAGGPAMGAMIASAVTGSFVGGGGSNVAITGPITIPAMKKAGYTAEQAGAIEAMASNASNITPPVLGTVAFIMSEIIGVHYIEIIVMSLVPAFLWFLSSGVYIYAHAQKNRDQIRTIHAREVGSESIPWHRYVRSGLLLAGPVATILILVLNGYTLRMGTVGAFSVAMFLGAVLRIETRWSAWSQGFRRAAYWASSVTLILVAVTVIADAISFTYLGGRLSNVIDTISGGHLLAAGTLMIIFGIFLGAGLPALAIYFIMSLTFAPILQDMGVDFKVSHYTAFYIGTLEHIIPPVATSALVAAGVAGTRYWPVCKVLAKMSWPLWVFPLLFLIAPELLLQGDSSNGFMAMVILSSAATIVGVQTATAGWLLRPVLLPTRIILYANFGMLVVALRQDLVTLMGACVAVVVGAAIFTIVAHGHEADRATGAVAVPSPGADT